MNHLLVHGSSHPSRFNVGNLLDYLIHLVAQWLDLLVPSRQDISSYKNSIIFKDWVMLKSYSQSGQWSRSDQCIHSFCPPWSFDLQFSQQSVVQFQEELLAPQKWCCCKACWPTADCAQSQLCPKWSRFLCLAHNLDHRKKIVSETIYLK